jgi:hypothetical protein
MDSGTNLDRSLRRSMSKVNKLKCLTIGCPKGSPGRFHDKISAIQLGSVAVSSTELIPRQNTHVSGSLTNKYLRWRMTPRSQATKPLTVTVSVFGVQSQLPSLTWISSRKVSILKRLNRNSELSNLPVFYATLMFLQTAVSNRNISWQLHQSGTSLSDSNITVTIGHSSVRETCFT